MRAFGYDCGCDNRREIMFTAGELGVREGVVLVVIVSTLLLAWRMKA